MAQANNGGCGWLMIAGIGVFLVAMCSKDPKPSALMDASTATAASMSTMYVAAASVNCRADANGSAAVTEKLRLADEVQAGETSGTWSHVTTQSIGRCWVATRLLAEDKPTSREPMRASAPRYERPSYFVSPPPQSRKRRSSRLVESGGSCGGKRVCGQMNSCAEAYHYLNQCGLSRLDRDGDGIPCESIC
jgi:hypothetical protein